MNETIHIVSTYANDILLDDQGVVFARHPGGPIRFIERALTDVDVPHQSHSGEDMDVEILVTDKGEFGRVSQQPAPRKLSEIGAPKWAIVSTVLDEWTIDDAAIPQKLFVDIQGYVRDGGIFVQKRQWSISPQTAQKIYCVKGTEEEITYIPADILESQKQRLLIVTKGADGVDIYHKGKLTTVPAVKVRTLKDTIGAGDTFLAYLAASLYAGLSVPDAGMRAAHKTAEFLRTKN